MTLATRPVRIAYVARAASSCALDAPGKFAVVNMPAAGSKSVLKPSVIPRTMVWPEDEAFWMSMLPPVVIVCAPRFHVSVSSML